MTMPEEKTLLIVEDDRPLRERLARAMESRGFVVTIAEGVAEGKARVKESPPAYAVVDLKLEDGNGLDVLETLHGVRPDSRVVVLTGFGNIATAVAAVKYGAIDYLPKPAERRRHHGGVARSARLQAQAAGESDVGGPRALGAYPAGLRALRPQCLGDGAPPQHAPAHAAAHPGEEKSALIFRSRQARSLAASAARTTVRGAQSGAEIVGRIAHSAEFAASIICDSRSAATLAKLSVTAFLRLACSAVRGEGRTIAPP